MPFKKGEANVNPGGRPKSSQWIREKISRLTEAHIKEARALKDETDDPKLKWDILKWFMEMDIGKPAQAVTGADGGPIQVAGVRIYLPPELEADDGKAEE
jgi:hypothetical protein